MAAFLVTDDCVQNQIPFRKTKSGRYVVPLGDNHFVPVSKRLAERFASQSALESGYPVSVGSNQVLLNSHDDELWRERALVKLCITAVPARKRVSYHLPDRQILMRAPVRRQFGRCTHRWHELLVWMTPGQIVEAAIESKFTEIKIEPLIIKFENGNLTCVQRNVSPVEDIP